MIRALWGPRSPRLPWHEEMVHDGLAEQVAGALAVPHELTDFQADFLGAKQELLAAHRQLAAAGKSGPLRRRKPANSEPPHPRIPLAGGRTSVIPQH
jgi:hypothetical protein